MAKNKFFISPMEVNLFEALTEKKFVLKKYIQYLSHKLSISYCKERFRQEIIRAHAQIKMALDEADFHLRTITFPGSEIDLKLTYSMKEASEILGLTRRKVMIKIHDGEILARKENSKVYRPYKWYVDAYALNERSPKRIFENVTPHTDEHFHLNTVFPKQA